MFAVTCFNFVAIMLICNVTAAAAAARPNILLIIVDDLRTTLGCYGDVNAYTPNIDALAENGIVFTEAFAQQALCAPSRNSFLTGKRPDTLRLYDFYSYWRDAAGNYTTLPEHLKNNGYTTMSIGKVFHPGISCNGSDDSPYSWTEKPFHPYTDRYKNAPVCRTIPQSEAATNLICPVRVSTMPNKTLPDLETLREARRFVHEHRKDVVPFFLAVGFQKPHVPLKYPEHYLKYHPLRKFTIPEPYLWPNNVNDVAYNPWTDLRWRKDVAKLKLKFPWERMPKRFAKRIIQSYYAAVSYIDNMIGKLIHQLHTSMIRENTIVILTSDHGWALGEHAVWSKYSNFDVTVHVPLIMSIPKVTSDFDMNYDAIPIDRMRYNAQITNSRNKTENKINSRYTSNAGEVDVPNTSTEYAKKYKKTVSGAYIRRGHDKSASGALHSKKHCRKVTDAIVELVDIFPTIADLAGVPIPICQVNSTYDRSRGTQARKEMPDPCGEGITLLPLIKSILKCQSVSWKKAAFSQYPRPGIQPTLHPNSDKPRLREINIMGYTLKTGDYRYTAWVPFAHTTCKPDWNVTIAEELYDHKIDRAEDFNIAASPKMLETKQYLRTLLKDGWRSALPKY
ncbi:PREDICTED: iduronate 2-sulfatase isoform X2 [Wasmannia auropunctata]|nr:PREDICTED: iduronate 2-sulfatase isoform X2 [Wasmannia auropunctata]XP_011702368.1 PREDICTED: iduronate 2-sulfatase isoform X2 [Wasmannia auropunctata]XP_011702369.1 PREDICTED: iduronate 2-sulfatase isoform X2 [Wasmannia auropunctata]XP_011702371.1 PREDICTED: iduronate 2-sulfatase isoform X2 [Wasmannia auropunctata]XP_011702372.1 PREDICTED: iduronate 2-sulfatase isoform X2 [Wasmannia auropunctata]